MKPSTANFAAAYASLKGCPTTPCTLPMLTRWPPLARRSGMASRLTATAPTKLTSSALRSASRVDISMVGSKLEMPALLTTASRRPYGRADVLEARRDGPGVGDVKADVTSTPASRRSGSRDGSRIVATTRQPAADARTAVAWPMPVEVPVTSTTFVMRYGPRELGLLGGGAVQQRLDADRGHEGERREQGAGDHRPPGGVEYAEAAG